MPSQLLAIVWIVSTDEQFGEKLNSFQSLNKIEISKDNHLVLFKSFHRWTKGENLSIFIK